MATERNLLSLSLLDDEAVEVIADLARLEIELADAAQRGGHALHLTRQRSRRGGEFFPAAKQ